MFKIKNVEEKFEIWTKFLAKKKLFGWRKIDENL